MRQEHPERETESTETDAVRPALILIKEDGSTEELLTLRQIRSTNRTRVRLVLSTESTEYIYPGQHEAIEKVILKVGPHGKHVEFRIITALDDMIAVVDPKRTTPEAIAKLREYHEEQITKQFLHKIFVENYVVLPDKEVLSVHTDKNKIFVFMDGSCWEVTATNELIPVVKVPDQKVIGVRMGTYKLKHSVFSYTAHSAYAEDIAFGQEDNGKVPTPPLG